MELTTKDIASVDAGYWAELNNIKLQADDFSFEGREYQQEPMSCKARRLCYMKATQGGFTEIEVLKALHDLIYKILPKGVLYLFPTADEVQDFGKSRFNPLIEDNPLSIGNYVKSTDTASLKKIHRSFLYLRGARLSQKMKDSEKESSRLRGIPVDRFVGDEVGLMSESVFNKARMRMADSDKKEEVYVSNPGVPDEDIDALFKRSDQRHWFRKCTCGEWTCAELYFFEDPERCIGIRQDGTGFIRCKKCGGEIPIFNGEGSAEWVPAVRENTDYMVGYNWSQLTSNKNDPAEILEQYRDPPEGNLGDIIKLRLGQAYIAAEDRLTPHQVYNCCGPNGMPAGHSGPCAMGIDVGKIKHIVIGTRTGTDNYELVKMVRLSDWNDIYDLARRFNVKSCVVDARPYEDEARNFQSIVKFRTFLCEYKENTPHDVVYNHNTGLVAVNRTEIFDRSHRVIITPGKLRIPRNDLPETREFVKQVCNAYKLLETNEKTNQSVYRYKGRNEHFRNALNYFLLAAEKSQIASTNRYKKKYSKCKNDYARI